MRGASVHQIQGQLGSATGGCVVAWRRGRSRLIHYQRLTIHSPEPSPLTLVYFTYLADQYPQKSAFYCPSYSKPTKQQRLKVTNLPVIDHFQPTTHPPCLSGSGRKTRETISTPRNVLSLEVAASPQHLASLLLPHPPPPTLMLPRLQRLAVPRIHMPTKAATTIPMLPASPANLHANPATSLSLPQIPLEIFP